MVRVHGGRPLPGCQPNIKPDTNADQTQTAKTIEAAPAMVPAASGHTSWPFFLLKNPLMPATIPTTPSNALTKINHEMSSKLRLPPPARHRTLPDQALIALLSLLTCTSLTPPPSHRRRVP